MKRHKNIQKQMNFCMPKLKPMFWLEENHKGPT